MFAAGRVPHEADDDGGGENSHATQHHVGVRRLAGDGLVREPAFFLEISAMITRPYSPLLLEVDARRPAAREKARQEVAFRRMHCLDFGLNVRFSRLRRRLDFGAHVEDAGGRVAVAHGPLTRRAIDDDHFALTPIVHEGFRPDPD